MYYCLVFLSSFTCAISAEAISITDALRLQKSAICQWSLLVADKLNVIITNAAKAKMYAYLIITVIFKVKLMLSV